VGLHRYWICPISAVLARVFRLLCFSLPWFAVAGRAGGGTNVWVAPPIDWSPAAMVGPQGDRRSLPVSRSDTPSVKFASPGVGGWYVVCGLPERLRIIPKRGSRPMSPPI